MTPGVLLMQELCAGNLGTEEQQLPIQVLILAKEQEKYYWTIWLARDLRDLFSLVHIMESTATTVDMVKMQV